MLVGIYFYTVWLLAGFVTGLTSFGSNLIAVPLLSFAYEPQASILVGCLSAFIIFLALGIAYYRAIVWKETILLVLGAFTGMPAGVWFLEHAGPAILLFAAGFTVALFLLWQFFAARKRRVAGPIGLWFVCPMGIASGILMGSVGMGGPPLVLYVFLRNFGKAETISTINAASVGIMLGVLPWQYLVGLFSPELLRVGALGGIAGVAGILASMPFVRRLNVSFFRKLLLIMLALSAVALVWRGTLALG